MAQCQRGRYEASKRRTLNAGSLQRPRHSEAATHSLSRVRFQLAPGGERDGARAEIALHTPHTIQYPDRVARHNDPWNCDSPLSSRCDSV